MKPLKSETQDGEALQELGRASVQVIHDLKNQINGLKLYATFLRKRLEKAERPVDELETLAKLDAGLERAATDMTALVRYGRPLELRRAPRTDLAQIVRAAAAGADVEIRSEPYVGEFDSNALTEAFKNINKGVQPANPAGAGAGGSLRISLRRETDGGILTAVIEWEGTTQQGEADPFNSFAGGKGLRMALAAKVIKAHDGEIEWKANILRIRLPLSKG